MIGERLQYLRELRKVSKKKVAKALAIHETTYGKYELSVRKPDIDAVDKLADYFNVSTDYLLGRTDDPTPPTGEPSVTPQERKLIEAYRNNPDMQSAVNRLLGVDSGGSGAG